MKPFNRITIALFALILAMSAQTFIDSSSQIKPRPSMVVAEFSNCQQSGLVWDCNGIGYARLKFADGTEKKFFLTPADQAFTPDSNWNQTSVVLPSGPTTVACSQTKP